MLAKEMFVTIPLMHSAVKGVINSYSDTVIAAATGIEKRSGIVKARSEAINDIFSTKLDAAFVALIGSDSNISEADKATYRALRSKIEKTDKSILQKDCRDVIISMYSSVNQGEDNNKEKFSELLPLFRVYCHLIAKDGELSSEKSKNAFEGLCDILKHFVISGISMKFSWPIGERTLNERAPVELLYQILNDKPTFEMLRDTKCGNISFLDRLIENTRIMERSGFTQSNQDKKPEINDTAHQIGNIAHMQEYLESRGQGAKDTIESLVSSVGTVSSGETGGRERSTSVETVYYDALPIGGSEEQQNIAGEEKEHQPTDSKKLSPTFFGSITSCLPICGRGSVKTVV